MLYKEHIGASILRRGEQLKMDSTVVTEEGGANSPSVFGNGVVHHDCEDVIWALPTKSKKAKKKTKTEVSTTDAPIENKEPAKSWPAVFHSILAAQTLVAEISSPYSEYAALTLYFIANNH